MIAYPTASVPVRSDYLTRLFTDKGLIQTLAAQFVANQAEAHIDMMADCPTEYTTFQDVARALSAESVAETTREYLKELMAEFTEELFAAVNTRRIAIKTITLSSDGFTDADIEVE